MLACVVPSHTMARTLSDFAVKGWAGPWSWYSCWPDVCPVADERAFPPKVALSPLSAVMRPPSLILISQSGVVTGSTQVFVAAPTGSPAFWTPLLLVSAYAVIVSAPGAVGPV